MEHEGFLDTRKPKPFTFGLIVAGHVAVLAAIIMPPAETFVRITWLPTKLINIPQTTPPPEIRQKSSTSRTANPIDHPTKLVPTQPQQDGNPIVIDVPPLTTGAGGTETLNPPKFEPVTTTATIDPSAAGRFQPDYPLQLVRADVEGSATVRVLIGTDGHVKQVEMVSATDPAFFDATRKQALRYWRFRPATSDGTPTESWRTMTVKFRLQS